MKARLIQQYSCFLLLVIELLPFAVCAAAEDPGSLILDKKYLGQRVQLCGLLSKISSENGFPKPCIEQLASEAASLERVFIIPKESRIAYADILNRTREAGYEVSVERGVLLVRSKALSKTTKSPLNMRVGDFTFTGTVDGFQEALFSHCIKMGIAPAFGGGQYNKLKQCSVTARKEETIEDMLIRWTASGGSGWTATVNPGGNEGDVRYRSLYFHLGIDCENADRP